MNGPTHYTKAERLLTPTTRGWNGGTSTSVEPPSALDVAMAQVHATLALTAAVVGQRMHDPDRQEFGHSNVDRAFYEVTK